MANDSLCVGDVVCLYSEEAYGFVFSLQSSTIHSELAVKPKQDRERPDLQDPQAISFQLSVANRYKLEKKCRKMQAKVDVDSDNMELKAQLTQSLVGARAEAEDNSAEQARQRGKKVLYGQVIQLKHIFTQKFLHVSTTQTSETESSNMQVSLTDFNAKHAQFRIMPRYKVKAEGDVVQVEDQIVLESVKSPGQYLHVSKPVYDKLNVYAQCQELNLSVVHSGFTVYRRYKPEKDHNELIKREDADDSASLSAPKAELRGIVGAHSSGSVGMLAHKMVQDEVGFEVDKAGVPIRLFHKEIEAYLCIEGLFDDCITEELHLRMRPISPSNPKSLFPSSSAITYWMVEMEEGPISGAVLRWEQQCRFKHMTTRMYLIVQSNKRVALTKDHTDPSTVFRLHPVIKEKDQIEFETFCRIEHVVTGTWLHASTDEYERKQMQGQGENDMSMAGLRWTTAQLKQVSVSDDMQYDDAFTLQKVEEENIRDFNYMAGMVPFIQKVITEKRQGMVLTQKITNEVVQVLVEIKRWMVVNSVPCKPRQKLLRNLRVVELLVSMLQVPVRGSQDQGYLTRILVECYDVLYTYLKGNSRKNELYIAKHIDFFESQIRYEGDIGLNAAHMVMELVKDNRKIVDRITHNHIDKFVLLLHKNKNYHYLDLLSVLCVCDGVSIPDNQQYITEVWLIKSKNCVYHTELGQAIGRDSNVVYVSSDNRRTFTALHEFVQGRDFENDDEFQFLDHQLDLFGKLCYGRNEYAIDVITQKLGYLTWEEAFLCLTNRQLPDQLRAKYCHLIISLFVDVGENTSVVDRINLTFIYEEIGSNEQSAEARANAEARERSLTNTYFPQLSDWISKFLDENKDMTASMIGHNMLVEQVLRLVHYLVRYGYYGDMNDIKKLLGPLLSLLDGRNDKPYPNTTVVAPGVTEMYQKTDRYNTGPETKAIVDAKYQAMEVLDLFFNFRFNVRLERFVGEFKQTYSAVNHTLGTTHKPELQKLLSPDFDVYESESVNALSIKRLKDLFTTTSYFGHLPITEIVLDLSHYEYDKMVTKSMALLDRSYSGFDNLFKRAVQAQVLITEESSRILYDLRSILPTMQRLTSAKMTSEQTKTMIDILDKMTSFCHLENEPDEPHPMNQSILYNHDILATIFDVLSQEIDIRLVDQYSGIRTVFQKCFLLLRAMANLNEVVQRRLFDRMDMLLEIEGAESEMAQALTEVFTGNKHTCMKILPHQVQAIMQIISQKTVKAIYFLDLLNAVVKVEELNLPLKRNQGYVMKYFMQYRSEVAYVIDQSPEARQKLLAGDNCPELEYLIALVDLLATCAEGENRFIESICQTIFSSDELLDVMNNSSVENNLKRPYLRFFLWVYLNTAGGAMDSGQGELNHDKRMWNYMNNLADEVSSLTDYVSTHTQMVKQLLKKPPPRSGLDESKFSIPLDNPTDLNDLLSEQGFGDYRTHHGTLHYLFEAAMPFLSVFFKSYYKPDIETHPAEADIVDRLATNLVAFIDTIGPLMCNPTHMKTLVSSMNVILTSSTLSVKVMEAFQQKYGGNNLDMDIRSDARKTYEEYYSAEESLNEALNIFSINYSAAYGGINTVQAQLGYASDAEYTDIGGDEELPLGEEFQEHIACFIIPASKSLFPFGRKNHKSDNYKLCGKLVQQLEISGSNTQMSEKERLAQEELDIKCLQLLRGCIHNEIIKLPDEWEADVKANKKVLDKIDEVQIALNEEDAMLKVLGHLARPSDELVRELLCFIACMLFGGNISVQNSLIEYFLGTREEKFFFAIKNRMQLSAIATKEKRSLMAQHQNKIDEALEQARSLAKAMKTGKLAAEEIMAANSHLDSAILQSQVTMRSSRNSTGKQKNSSIALKNRYGSQSSLNKSKGAFGSKLLGAAYGEYNDNIEMGTMDKRKKGHKEDTQILLQKDNKVAPAPSDGELEKEKDKDDFDAVAMRARLEEAMGDSAAALDTRDDGFIELVLRILGLMCDGQNSTLQDYLREQPDNIKSVNLVTETARFLSLVYSSINRNTIGLVIELFNTLVEFCSGNLQNQLSVFDNKICDYINFILRSAQFQGCDEHDVLELKKAIAVLIIALTEENPKAHSDLSAAKPIGLDLARDVMDSLDAESLENVIQDCYKKSVMDPKRKEPIIWEDAEDIGELGFLYYMVLCRMSDLLPPEEVWERPKNKDQQHNGIDRDQCRKFYKEGVLSIELIKDDEIQKIYFRCKDSSVLREDVKELFKYEVDRSSPSNKLREFMDWSRDIMDDIKYTRRVYSHPLARFFAKYWMFFNGGMLLTSLVMFIVILVFWVAPTDNAIIKPEYRYNQTIAEILTWVVGGIHNLFSVFTFISYIITNHPTLPDLSGVKKFFKERCRKKTKDEIEEETVVVEEGKRDSNLEVKIISFRTIWYISLLAFSILGTIFWGYFLAFHLLHIAWFNQLILRAIKAVTKNGTSLLWVFLYGVLFLLIYALLSFAFYRNIYDSAVGNYCTTVGECLITVLHRGLIVGTYEYLEVPEGLSFEWHVGKAVFDLIFFIIITTIGLNIIFGIIVDTFSELRDNKWQVDNDMHTCCFICSRNSYDFEHQGGGFEQHVKQEHNQWAYLFFFIHLDETRPNDYTSIELYVSRKLEKENYDFFPLNRALSLQQEEDGNEIRLETLMSQVTYLVNKMKEEESEKERVLEKKRQQEWEEQHRNNANQRNQGNGRSRRRAADDDDY